VPDVIAQLEDPSWLVRAAALAALPDLGGDAAAVEAALAPSLHHDHGPTRVAAARALWRLGETETAVGHLIGFLSETDSRAEAASVLGEIGPEARDAVARLAEVLEDRRDPDEGYRVARALGDIGPDAETALPALRTAAEDPNGHVSAAARYALSRIERR
jgi:HEAT repeat protein